MYQHAEVGEARQSKGFEGCSEARVQGVTQRVSLLPLWGQEGYSIMSVVGEVLALACHE